MSTIKTTPAMKIFCRSIKDPTRRTVCFSPSWSMVSSRGWSSMGSPTIGFLDRVKNAGLIEFKTGADGYHVAHLTESGQAVANG
jgi:hypothetical protein